MDLTWLCPVAVMLIMLPVIYYGTRSRMNYAKQLLRGGSSPRGSINTKFNTRFTNLDEYYKAINALIECLKNEGHAKEAQKLYTLMHTAWTTSSELLGELQLALKGMKGHYSQKLRKEIDECFEFALHHRKILGL